MSILTEAEEIINGQRAMDYGDAKVNHERIAALWNPFLQNRKWETVTPEDVAVMMILVKIARYQENGYHHDTTVDIAGYAGVLEKMQLPKSIRYQSGAGTTPTMAERHLSKSPQELYTEALLNEMKWDKSHHDNEGYL